MASTNIRAKSIDAEKAVKILHGQILNPPTSIATAILPSRIASRLSLASSVFSVECFLEARKQDRPELALISAALPASYMQADMMANAMDLALKSPDESSLASIESEGAIKVALPRSKIDLARGIAELPPARASSIQVVFSDLSSTISADSALAEEDLVFGLAAAIWDAICSFRGLL